MPLTDRFHTLIVFAGPHHQTLTIPHGANLRRTLLQAHLSPYTVITRRANCGGRGLCATCGVWIEQGAPPPIHWHDVLAASFGYPRLSCQIYLCNSMTVHLLTDKLIWGKRQPTRRYLRQ